MRSKPMTRLISKKPEQKTKPFRGLTVFLAAAAVMTVYGCATTSPEPQEIPPEAAGLKADQLMVVDCLLPGQVRQMGSRLTYLSPRRPIKTTASDCEIRGGEYVSFDRSNYATALKIWLPQAQEGNPEAQTYVGEIYEKGLGIQADYKIAAEWYRRAAEQGHSRAQINLGYLYEGGLGVERDLTTAMNWYRQASGLIDGDLEFVSSIEAANREAKAIEHEQLKTENVQLKSELEQTKTQLAQRQKTLGSSERRVAELRKQLETKRQELAEAEANTTVVVSGADPELEEKLNRAEEEKTRLTERLAKEQLAKRKLEREQQATVAELEKSQQTLTQSRSELALAERQLNEQKQILSSSSQDAQKLAELNEKVLQLQQTVQQQEADTIALETQSAEQRTTLESEIAKSRAAEKELQNALDKRNSDVDLLKQQLAATETANQEKLAQADRDLQTARAEQQRLTSKLATQQLASRKNTNEQIAKLEKELKSQEDLVFAQRSELDALEGKLLQTQARLNNDSGSAVVAAVSSGPVIEIIDPPLMATRGTPQMNLRSAVPEIEIIGRIESQTDLLSFRVNDQAATVESNGLFRLKKTVNASGTPMNLVAIDQDGQRTALEFVLNPNKSGRTQQVASSSKKFGAKTIEGVEFGNYYALVIGNNAYPKLTNLNTAANDAQVVADILENKYGFNTKLLINADRYTMLSELNKLRETLTEKDNLLIYYAGHGELDKVNLRGYWLPVDSEADSSANWISNVAITDVLNVMSAKHILVVADSCYSGSMTRSSLARLEAGLSDDARKKWYQAMNNTKARAVLTSGGVKPVLDSGGGEHSIFAKAFIDVLRENDGVLEGFKLYREVQQRVKNAAAALNVDQEPQYAPIKYAGHEAGEFFLLPDSSAAAQPASKTFLSAMK